MVWRLEQNIKMMAFAFCFDTNKELNYPFLVTRLYAGHVFNDFHDTAQILYAVTLDMFVHVGPLTNSCRYAI